MRRFEKDDRFWEISLEGQSVTTRSGTRKGKGRSSSKRYPSSKAALAEIEARIAKRMTEPGWFEVLPPFAGPVDLSPRIDGLDPERVARWQHRPGTLEVDGPEAARTVTRALSLSRDRFVAGLKAGASLPDPEVQAAVVRILQKGPAFVADGLVQRAVLLALAPEAETADLLVARFGVLAAVEAVASGPRYVVRRDLRTAHLEEGEPTHLRVRPAVARLRDLLLQASESDRAACEALAKQALGGSLARDLELVTLFPATSWVDAFLLDKGLGADTVQVSGAASPAAFRELVGRRVPTRHNSPERLLPYLEVVMQRHGTTATPAVLAVADALGPEGVSLMARVRTPETVERLVGLLGDATLGSAARAALIAMSDLTLATLLSPGRLSKGGAELADELTRQPGLVDALLPHLDEGAQRKLRNRAGDEERVPVTDEVPEVLRGSEGKPLEPWLRLPDLPPLRTPDGTHAYPPAACARALQRLSDGDELAEALGDACEPSSVDAFLAAALTAWADGAADAIYGTSPWRRVEVDAGDEVERRWVRDPKAPEELPRPWVLQAVKRLGGEACGRALFQCILTWGRQGGRYPELLSEAIEVMCALPGEEILVHLGALARRVPKAKVRIESYLKRLGVPDEMLLPGLGLDERGRRELSFGPRTFTVGFDPSLEPYVTGPDGKVRTSLPKAASSDDAALAKAAHAEWRELKKQVRSLRTTLLGRLEEAMRTQRVFEAEHFHRYLARHPLARHPVSALVWSVGEVRFRVDEAGEAVDADDEPVALDGRIRLVHPLALSDDERETWKKVLADYELIQPFDQLDREVYGPDGVAGLRGRLIPRGRLFALRNRGWVWQSASVVDDVDYERPMLHGLVLTLQGARVTLRAAAPIDVKADEGLAIDHVQLFDGTWDRLPPVAMSEIARDLRRATEIE